MSIKTTYQKVKDWNHRLDKRMQQHPVIPDIDHEHHICAHCGYGYDGRCCPQCGLQAGNEHFTFKRLRNNFLDIWGFGNRPMFRSIRDLMWRPGYMISDYLSGHHLSYFPPFKMLAVLTIIIVFIAWIFGFKDPLVGQSIANYLNNLSHHGKITTIAYEYIGRILVFLDKNDFYRILLQNVFVVLAAWIVFYKKGYNLVETCFSQIYINCQMHLIAIVWMLIAWDLPPTVALPYYIPATLALIILVFDYKQLYGLTLMQSIWKTILFILLVLTIYFVLFVLLLIIFASTDKITGG